MQPPQSASKPVRIGILGCAGVTRYALMNAATFVPEVEVVCVGSRSLEKAKAFAAEYNIPRYYGSYAQVIADPEVELLYNPLPNSLHLEWCRRALDVGKPMLCEKPITVNAAEAADLLTAMKQANGTLIEAYHYRYHPLGRRIAEIIASNILGQVRRVDIRFNVPAMLLASDIRSDYALGGGAAIDPGCYCVDMVRLVTQAEPEVRRALPQLIGPQVDDAMTVELAIPGGGVANFECSLNGAGTAVDNWLMVTGENGTMEVLNPCNPQFGHYLKLDVAGMQSNEEFELTPSYAFQLRQVSQVVRENAPVFTTVESGFRNMQVLDEIYKAAGLRVRGLAL